jgi:hypothetical protein
MGKDQTYPRLVIYVCVDLITSRNMRNDKKYMSVIFRVTMTMISLALANVM